jgi:hypothetical protein
MGLCSAGNTLSFHVEHTLFLDNQLMLYNASLKFNGSTMLKPINVTVSTLNRAVSFDTSIELVVGHGWLRECVCLATDIGFVMSEERRVSTVETHSSSNSNSNSWSVVIAGAMLSVFDDSNTEAASVICSTVVVDISHGVIAGSVRNCSLLVLLSH